MRPGREQWDECASRAAAGRAAKQQAQQRRAQDSPRGARVHARIPLRWRRFGARARLRSPRSNVREFAVLNDLLVLLAALLLLTLGAEGLVRGATAIGRKLGLSSFFIGMTIVGFGTSTPELFTSLDAALAGKSDIAVGNVVGSNIFNVAFILGITALVCPIPVQLGVVRKEVLVVIAVAVLPYLALLDDDRMGRVLGMLLFGLLVLHIAAGYFSGKRDPKVKTEAAVEELEREMGATARAWWSTPGASALWIALGLGLLVWGSHLLVGAASSIARELGVSELAIALTIVSGGTSAPELFTSVVAAKRKQPDIAIGNVLGSNIFNVLGILGLTCIVSPQALAPQLFALDLPVSIALSLALLPIVTSAQRITRTEGAVLLGAYVAYVYVLFSHAPGWFPKIVG